MTQPNDPMNPTEYPASSTPPPPTPSYPAPGPQAPYQGAPQTPYSGGYPQGAPQPPYQDGYQQGYSPSAMSQSDERLWAMFSHLGAIVTVFLVPLIIMLAFKDRSRFIKDQAREALNFSITMILVYLGIAVLSFVSTLLIFVSAPLAGILSVIIGIAGTAFGIAALVFLIMGAVKSYGGDYYRYPICIRLVK